MNNETSVHSLTKGRIKALEITVCVLCNGFALGDSAETATGLREEAVALDQAGVTGISEYQSKIGQEAARLLYEFAQELETEHVIDTSLT